MFADRSKSKSIIIFLLISVSSELALVYCYYAVSQWSNTFYSALQHFDVETLYNALMQFGFLITMLLAIVALRYIYQGKLSITLRQAMTERYLDKWLKEYAFYGIDIIGRNQDNPDQRISEDIKSFVALTVSLSLGLLNSLVTLASFLFMLWSMSGKFSLKFFGTEFVINGYFVWISLIYSLIGTLITYFIGKKLTNLDYLQEKIEALFRFNLMRLREYSESVSIYKGGDREQSSLYSSFHLIKDNFLSIMKITCRLNVWQTLYINISSIIPIIVALPKFLAKEIQLGGLMQIKMAFDQVTSALSFLVSSFASIASYKAVIKRLIELDRNISSWSDAMNVASKKFTEHYDNKSLKISDFSVCLPNGKKLLDDINLTFNAGCSYLIKGPNGVGKSTLVRALAKLWPFIDGQVCIPGNAKMFFLPQKIYLPNATLSEAICYPASSNEINQKVIKELILAFNLDGLINHLDEIKSWHSILSGGEQQKIGIIRAVIAQPDFLIIDEGTSGLTDLDEELAFKIINTKLRGVTLISVGHRTQLTQFHDNILNLTKAGGKNNED